LVDWKERELDMGWRVEAFRGTELRCKGWRQESLLRLLENVLETGEKPEELIVYSAISKAARNWECYSRIVQALKDLEEDETLVMQSGKPIGIFRTHRTAPLVVMANANIVPLWANMDYFYELDKKGLTMAPGYTAGDWQYIGSQGIVQGTYETFSLASEAFGGSLKGRLVLTAGLGGMGGAQPLAVTMNGGVVLAVEVNEKKIHRRIETGYCERMVTNLDDALELCQRAKKEGTPLSVGLLGNAAEVHPELLKRAIVPDIVTDQTSAHDELNGYIPAGLSVEEADALRKGDPKEYRKRALASIAIHMSTILEFQRRGSIAFEYGNNIRYKAFSAGVKDAFDVEGFIPKYIRPLFCEGRGPFRWIAVSGVAEDIFQIDEVVVKAFPDQPGVARWIKLAQEFIKFQGLPARICWLGHGERTKLGLLVNKMVRNGELKGPVAFTRDHLDSGAVARPYRCTEKMKDGSDAVADWPLLNALLNCSAMADLVAIHSGGGGNAGQLISSGVTVVADGSEESDVRLERVLTTDTGIGVLRHADAGYETAIRVAKERGIKMLI
jgi:urocanate hydratase